MFLPKYVKYISIIQKVKMKQQNKKINETNSHGAKNQEIINRLKLKFQF